MRVFFSQVDDVLEAAGVGGIVHVEQDIALFVQLLFVVEECGFMGSWVVRQDERDLFAAGELDGVDGGAGSEARGVDLGRGGERPGGREEGG